MTNNYISKDNKGVFDLIIIGAGPAGLTAAYKAIQSEKLKSTVLEKDPKYVGGISRTVDYKGYKFDIGGHRFFSKSQEVEDFWSEILGDDLLERPRLSRIFYKGKFFDYPLKPFNALFNLGIFETILILLSYFKVKIFPNKNPKTFEEWVTNQFGYRLFSIFFKTYTEKVWGMKCSEISADWAAQRIKGLSLSSAVITAIRSQLHLASSKGKDGEVIKTLIDKFRYPKCGPGQLWEKAKELIEKSDGDVVLGQTVQKIEINQNKVIAVSSENSFGEIKKYSGDFFISTMPIKHLLRCFDPKPPREVLDASNSLRYRDFITVALIIDKKDIFPDNWIYIHDPEVKLGRIQNFKNWSKDMVPDQSKTCLGLEYFCFEGDGLWNMSDADLIKLATKELSKLGLVKNEDVIDGAVVRMPKAYPVYDDVYKKHISTVRSFTDNFSNLYLVGRNGMHKYNNQDHSMMAAMIAIKNILGEKDLDPWKVNTDAKYHEEGDNMDAGRSIPSKVKK